MTALTLLRRRLVGAALRFGLLAAGSAQGGLSLTRASN